MNFFTPIDRMNERLEITKNDSDIAYFYDLLLLGEQTTKTITLFLVASLDEDNNRTKYRHEHTLVRANAIGDFSKTIEDILVGPSAELLSTSLRELEFKELTQRVSKGSWQYESLTQLIGCLNIFGIQHDEFGSKAPLRIWFQLFALLRNKTKGHGAPKLGSCSKACPLLLSSINTIVDNLNVFKRTWAYFHRNLSGKYRISPMSAKSTEYEEYKRDTTNYFENGIYCFIDGPTKVNLLYSNPELTDFFYPNGNLKRETFETISYVSDDRNAECAKAYMLDVKALPKSETHGTSQLEVVGNCFTNMPPQVVSYIQREELESELSKILMADDRFPVVTLVGRGGIGKTSLAIKTIQEIASTDRFSLILWFSARDIDLLLEGPKQVQTKVRNQLDIAQEYCRLLHPDTKIKDKVEKFSQELAENPIGKTLYVFDNFETITNPIELFELINNNIRNPNKILITSRISRNFKADYPIEVRGMKDLECKKLIDSFASKFGIKKVISDKYIDEIISESDGHPYIIKILLGEVAKTGVASKVKRIVAENEKVLIALFKRTFNTLSPAAKRVFLTLCSWNSSIPQVAIEAVLWRPENEKIDVQGAIEELQKSSFIELYAPVDEVYVSVPLAAAVFGQTELEVYPAKMSILEDRKLLMEFGVVTQRNISGGIAPRIERKILAVARRINSLSEFENELSTLEYIATRYPRTWIQISSIYEEYGEYEKVKYALRELLKASLPLDEKAKYWLKLANICKYTEDWEGESHALSELAIIPEISYELISDSANRINNYFHHHPDQRNIDYKNTFLRKVSDIMIQRCEEADATDYSRLAWLFMQNNDLISAKLYVEKGLEIDEYNSYCIRLLDRLADN